ncbi:MAG: hypothetical protein FJ306_07035, partial [Planctomycetes bacterium]|nr:hypothetical protein [Planctomycetota bacterium]
MATPAPSASHPAPATAPAGAPTPAFQPRHKIRLVTATSLFDGHDASIHIFRRIAQATGAEVVHLGHNRSVREIVDAAIQEDAQGIAVTSYQGGHNEFFRYMHDMLRERGAGHVRVFGGGGGVILPEEITALQAYGLARIYSPDDGRALGLQGMIDDMLGRCDFATVRADEALPAFTADDHRALAKAITLVENHPELHRDTVHKRLAAAAHVPPVLGITGTGGAGKSSLIDELLRRFLLDFPAMRIAVLCVDPTRKKTGGALLGDRIRMNSASDPRVFVRSMATRRANLALSESVRDALSALKCAGFELIVLESSGIGQSDTEIVEHADVSLYVMTPEFGAQSQLEKIDMLDYADLVAINKFDRRGARDALRDVQKQFQRNKKAWDKVLDQMPVYGTMAATFADPGANRFYKAVAKALDGKRPGRFASTLQLVEGEPETAHVIPGERVRYLADIVEHNRRYNRWSQEQADLAERAYALRTAADALPATAGAAKATLLDEAAKAAAALAAESRELLAG